MMTRIKGWVRPFYAPVLNRLHDILWGARRYRYLFREIRTGKVVRIMEIGTWNGDRAVRMIQLAMRSTSMRPIEYYGFDLFEDLKRDEFCQEISKWPPSRAEVESKVRATGANIHIYAGDTNQSLPAVVHSLPKMDLIFIDGGHSVETILNDWKCTAALMHETTVVLFDDYWNDNISAGAKPIVDAIDRTLYDVCVLPIVDHFENPEFGPLSIQFARVTKHRPS